MEVVSSAVCQSIFRHLLISQAAKLLWEGDQRAFGQRGRGNKLGLEQGCGAWKLACSMVDKFNNDYSFPPPLFSRRSSSPTLPSATHRALSHLLAIPRGHYLGCRTSQQRCPQGLQIHPPRLSTSIPLLRGKR